MNNVTLIGRLTADPILKYTTTGTATTTFTLAIDRGLTKQQKEECEANNRATADFINIVVWRKQAENCANYLVKGRLTAVQGRIQTRSYDANDGTKRYVTEVVASSIEFLEWGDKAKDTSKEVPTGFHPVDSEDIPF